MRLKLIIVFSFILCNIYPSGIYKYRVYLKDKQGAVLSDDFVTEKSKERREIQNVVADFSDLPVSDIYIRDLSDKGYDIVTKSKWMNTVVVSSAKDDALTELKSLSYADSVDIVWCGNQTRTLQKKRISEVSAQTAGENIYPQNDTTYHLYMHNTHQLHEMGFTGKGITVAVVDAGFQSVDNNPILNKNVLGAVDFVYETDNPYCDDKHGTNVLSVITAGGDSPIYGVAPDSHFWLLRSEFGDTEFQVEEDYWIAAVEFADSVGADIVTSSLGYNRFDDFKDYTTEDLDGKTAFITRAANIAFEKGLFIICSAGNEARNSWQKIVFPADAPNVLTVGAVGFDNLISDFSSIGFVRDGYIKPDVVSLGLRNFLIGPSGSVERNSGTSFSTPVIAGVAACLKQAFPEMNNSELLNLFRENSSQSITPDSFYGYGIPDAYGIYKKAAGTTGIVSEKTVDNIKVYYSDNDIWVVCNCDNELRDYVVSLFDVTGKLVKQDKIRESGKINTDGINNGVYILKLSTGKSVYTTKITKGRRD